jgi:hypothetical protein
MPSKTIEEQRVKLDEEKQRHADNHPPRAKAQSKRANPKMERDVYGWY